MTAPARAYRMARDDANIPDLVLELLRDLAWQLALNPDRRPRSSPTAPPPERPA